MFFYQRKPKIQTRRIKIRNEWGELETHEINLLQFPTDKELQDQLQTTVLARRVN
jgi:hypothetical protein